MSLSQFRDKTGPGRDDQVTSDHGVHCCMNSSVPDAHNDGNGNRRGVERCTCIRKTGYLASLLRRKGRQQHECSRRSAALIMTYSEVRETIRSQRCTSVIDFHEISGGQILCDSKSRLCGAAVCRSTQCEISGRGVGWDRRAVRVLLRWQGFIPWVVCSRLVSVHVPCEGPRCRPMVRMSGMVRRDVLSRRAFSCAGVRARQTIECFDYLSTFPRRCPLGCTPYMPPILHPIVERRR